MNGTFYRLLGWLGPIACIAAAGFTIVNRQQMMQEADRQQRRAEAEYETANAERAKVLTQAEDRRYAAETYSPLEERDFIDYLRRQAAITGTTIVGWTSSSATFGPREQSSLSNVPFTDEEAKAIAGITRVTCVMKLAGEYQAIRSFIHTVMDSDRLITLNHVLWGRDKAGSQLSVSISRYTVAPKTGAGADTADTTQKAGTP